MNNLIFRDICPILHSGLLVYTLSVSLFKVPSPHLDTFGLYFLKHRDKLISGCEYVS